MAAGFAMLEAGLVRSKNVTTQLTKNIALFSIAAIAYFLVGFNLMYPGDGWLITGYLGPIFSLTGLEPVGATVEQIGDISYAIQEHAEKYNYGVVRELVGHGIGRKLHESPEVPNYGKKGKGKKIQEGMVIAIEPMINMGSHKIKQLNDGAIIINLSREAIVDSIAVLKHLETSKIKTYVTDFPNGEMINHKDVLVMPHLGASTKEAQINCAVMVAKSIKSYLETGNILNSVNFPNVKLSIKSPHRLTITNKNVPNIIGQFTSILGNSEINIDDLSHKVLDDIGYTILNVDKLVPESVLHEISNIDGVMKTNLLF